MSALLLVCVFCGSAPIEMHHLSGRCGPRLAYHDPRLVVALCKTCHDREHVVLRRLALEWSGTDPLRHRLLRVGDHLGRLADAGRGLVLDPASTRALSGLVLVAADHVAAQQVVAS